MKVIAVVLSILGVACAGLLPATLVPKVNVAPAQVTVVKQPIHVTQTEYVYRSVPEPVKAVAYTAPVITAPAVVAAAPAITTHAIAAPAILPHSIASPAILSHAIW